MANPVEPSGQQYPYGLRLCLTHVEMAKLGIEGEISSGDLIHLNVMAEVTSMTRGDDQHQGEHARMELQIVGIMAMEDETTER